MAAPGDASQLQLNPVQTFPDTASDWEWQLATSNMAASGDDLQPPAQTFPATASDTERQPIRVSSCTSQEAPAPTAAFAQPYQFVHPLPERPAVAGASLVGEVSSSQAASSEGTRSALRTASGQRKGKAERRRAMQSSQSQTCHAMKPTQTDLDRPRLDKVLTQNAAYLNYIHKVTRWMPYFLVAVLFIWPLLMLCTGHLLFSQGLEAHKKEILDWKGKHDQCEGKLQSINQQALACESRVRKTLQEQDKLNRAMECSTSLADLEDNIAIARRVDIKLSSRLADAILSQDVLRARHGSCLRELAKRPDETDKKVKQRSDVWSKFRKTLHHLHHGLHWMWKFESLDKQNNHLMEALQALEEQLKELEASPEKTAFARFFASGSL